MGAAGQPDVLRWTKTLHPGVSYLQEVRLAEPLVIHALRFKYPAEGVRFETRIAKDAVFIRNAGSRETVDEMAKRVGAFAAVNADFFGWDGDPLGIQVTRGELVSEPYVPRAAAAWANSALMFDAPQWKGNLVLADGSSYAIDGVNRSCKPGEAILNTLRAGVASSKDPCYAFLFEIAGDLSAGNEVELKLKNIFPETFSVPMQEKEAVLMATSGRGLSLIKALKVGQTCRARMELTGQINWSAIQEAIGGGPRIVKEGKAMVNSDAERFDRSMTLRHPRTAIGYTSGGEVVLCVVDGRSTISRGATFEELAEIMLRLGCTDAINLDGGGSSTLYVAGAVLNRPSDGPSRPVANALLLFLPDSPPGASPKFAIRATAGPIKPGDVIPLSLLDESGAAIPASEVLWSATGPGGWVDAGGNFRATTEGKAKVRAWARGFDVTLDLEITKNRP
jgi:exopolysaccharide biosynthesis protein